MRSYSSKATKSPILSTLAEITDMFLLMFNLTCRKFFDLRFNGFYKRIS